MSKPVKALLRTELKKRLEGVESLAVVSLMGVDGPSNNQLRRQLFQKQIHVTVVKNSIARQALKEVGLDAVGQLLEGPCALATGADSVVAIVRELLARKKEVPNLVVRGAYLEGSIFGPERVEELSKYPTRDEAIGQAVMLVRSPGSRLASCIIGPGGKLAAILKAIQEKAEQAASAETPAAEAAPAEAAPAAAPAEAAPATAPVEVAPTAAAPAEAAASAAPPAEGSAP